METETMDDEIAVLELVARDFPTKSHWVDITEESLGVQLLQLKRTKCLV